MVGGLLVSVLSARTMGPFGRGQLALFLQVAYVANMFSMAGIDRAYPITAPQGLPSRTAVQEVGRLILSPTITTATMCLPIGFALGHRAGGGAAAAAGLALLIFSFAAAGCVRIAATVAGSGRIFVRATAIGEVILIGTGALLATVSEQDPNVWLLAYGLSLGIGITASWVILARAEPARTAPRDNLALPRRLGLQIMPAGIATMVMLRADRLLLPWLGSYSQLGMYVVVATFTELTLWPVQGFVDAFLPQWRRQALAGLLRRGPVLALATGYAATAATTTIVILRLMLVPVFGPGFRPCLPLIAPLAIGAALHGIGRIAVGLSLASERPRSILVADIPAAVVAVVCYVLLIPRFAAMGAALGSVIAYGSGTVLALAICARTKNS